MKQKVFLLLCLISLVTGCASDSGLRILEERSDMLSDIKTLELGVDGTTRKVGKGGELALVWRHEAPLPSGDLFLGGWLLLDMKDIPFSPLEKSP